jgi:hypothetical protein
MMSLENCQSDVIFEHKVTSFGGNDDVRNCDIIRKCCDIRQKCVLTSENVMSSENVAMSALVVTGSWCQIPIQEF